MGFGDCFGSKLPNSQSIDCPESINHFGDCCRQIGIEDEILLHERVKSPKGDFFYWVSLKADETPLVVCALEKYAERVNWQGRRADYLGVGWYSGDCYIVAIELRHALVTEERFEDKLNQLEQSIEWIASELLPDLTNSNVFTDACDNPEHYRIVGAMIPVAYSKKRAEQTRWVRVGEYETVIVAIPNSSLKECRISWDELLRAIGV